ncbi:MAG: HAD family hydrolase [Candidatus Heimdallarchaeaceae archaeon]
MENTNWNDYAILFDMDGVLISLLSRWIEPMEKVFKKVKPDFNKESIADRSDYFVLFSGGSSRNVLLNGIIQLCKLSGLSRFQTLKVILKLSYLFLFRRRKFKVVFLEGAMETLDYLYAEGFKLALVTSSSRFTLRNIKKMFPEIYNKFTCVLTRNDVKFTKPHPEQLLKAIKVLQVKKSNSVIVGDFASDIIAGKKAGIKTIAVLGEFARYSSQLLEREKPDLIIKDVQDLPKVIKDLFQTKI